jgi:hypothetical protein
MVQLNQHQQQYAQLFTRLAREREWESDLRGATPLEREGHVDADFRFLKEKKSCRRFVLGYKTATGSNCVIALAVIGLQGY